MPKQPIRTIAGKNRVIENIIDDLQRFSNFLILGHHNPDEDVIASMTAFALLVGKFSGNAKLFLEMPVHEHFTFLINICRYNSIEILESPGAVVGPVDAIVILDTPKPSMIHMNEAIAGLMADPGIRKIEIDHHMGGDSAYAGDEGYSLVTDASSSCELIGHIALKLLKKKDLLERYEITNLFSRNLNLSILSGIIGDSQMGKFLKSSKEKRYYELFSSIFNSLLRQQTVGRNNFGDMTQVFGELQRLSGVEEECHRVLLSRMRTRDSLCFIVLEKKDMDEILGICEVDIFISVTRSVANILAENSGKVGFVAYRDPVHPDLYQFKMRRSKHFKSYDLRSLLSLFSIEDGGGHAGAIAFRLPSDRVPDLEKFITRLAEGVEVELQKI